MNLLKIIFLLALITPSYANNSDDEIIKNLDFFQSMDLMKEENPFTNKKVTNVQIHDDQGKTQQETLVGNGDNSQEKKQ
jgi:hypothetical protein